MSYIRSTSNPESLYIWGDRNKTVHLSRGRSHGPSPVTQMPRNVFLGLIRKWHRNFQEDTKYKGASIKQVWVELHGKNQPQIELAYEDWKITMWEVTWYYIAYTNLENVNRHSKKKIIIE